MILTAPDRKWLHFRPSFLYLFAAGGITGAEQWQMPYCEDLDRRYDNLIIYNPRRENYDALDPAVEYEQIKWEFDCLQMSDIITFWFSPATIQPITLLEFGKALVWSNSQAKSRPKVFIAAHPDYVRRRDVIIQAALENPKLVVHESIEELTLAVCRYLDDIAQPKKEADQSPPLSIY